MKQFSPKVILITGGMGFIGSNFIHYLLANNLNVLIINLDLGTYAASPLNLQNLPDSKRHILIKGDINDRFLVNSILEEYNVDTIINFAAESHVDRSIADPSAFIRTNIDGTFNLLEAAKQFWFLKNNWGHDACRFYHVSTDEIYGCRTCLEEPSFIEGDAYAPRSPYAASKAASNHLVKSYYETYDFPVLISNCTNNYGPRQHSEKLIPKIITSCLYGNPIPIYGTGTNIRDWLYVTDHCSAIECILNGGIIGNEYNISAGNELSNIQVTETICKIMDKVTTKAYPHKQLIEFVSDRPGHDWRYSLNSSKLTQSLGWKPKGNFEQGLMATIESYLQLTKGEKLATANN